MAASAERVEPGAVAILSVGIGPIALRSPIRVVYVIDEADRRGFAYGTLRGHPESGEESFVLQRDSHGIITFTVSAFSRPGTWWSRLAEPAVILAQRVITRRYLRSFGCPALTRPQDPGTVEANERPPLLEVFQMQAAQPRAVIYSRTGPPDVLTLVEKPLLEPGPGQVRVRIHRSGVNPTDWKSRRGGAESAIVDPAQVPGQDGAGVVDAVGAGVDATRVGERVWIWEAAYQRTEGTSQDYALVPEVKAVHLPATASFDLGAGLGIPFLTAHRCLTVTEGGPQRLGPGSLAGRHVFVAGGAGAVGNAAIQLAHWSGATVITSVSSADKAQLAAAAGADHIINYRDADVAAEVRKIVPAGVNTIVEVSAAQNSDLDAAILAPDGSIAMYADDGGSAVSIPIRASMVLNARWQFVLVYTAPHEAKEHAVHSISAALADDAVKSCLPQHHFLLEETAKAHEAVQNSAIGKVLIDLAD